MVLLTFGFHAVAMAVAVDSAARRFRVVAPFTVVKSPPAYSKPFVGSKTMDSVMLLAFASHAEAVPVAVESAASRLRVVPPLTVVNEPEAYTRLLVASSASA